MGPYNPLDHPNKSTKIDRQNYGIKMARAGFDIRNASDNQLLFNSAWPILQIVRFIDLDEDAWENTPGFTPPSYAPNQRMRRWRHNLGYCPFFMILPALTDSSAITTIQYPYRVDRHYFYALYNPYDYTGASIPNYKFNARVVVTQINLENDVEYPYTDQALHLEFEHVDYGVKSSRFEGIDVHQAKPKELGINTNIISNIVLAVKTERSFNPSNEYDNGYGTIYKALAYIYPQGMDTLQIFGFYRFEEPVTSGSGGNINYAIADYEVQALGGLRVGAMSGNDRQGSWLTFFPTSTLKGASMVIVRLPFISPNQKQAVI